jgi:ABC-type transport system involved in Fe-S cluster assembly fused permease/ATPase subunit
LLLRFLAAESGKVLLAGHDVARLTSDDVRGVVGLVADDAHVFATSRSTRCTRCATDGSPALASGSPCEGVKN